MNIARQLRAITARYPGNCPACHKPIVPGETIKKEVGSGRYFHETCHPAQVSNSPTPPVITQEMIRRARRTPRPAYTPNPLPQTVVVAGDDLKQTLDEHYNALCTRLDRIMTGNPAIRVTGGATSSVAETMRDVEGAERGRERAHVRFDHDIIKRWARDGYDRTALTLALNIHELGHIWHTPSQRRGFRFRPPAERGMMNLIEDQRQEILTSLQYPRAVDYLRFLNARALELSVRMADRDVIDDRTGQPRPPTQEEADDKIGRQFLMHYGRRHLYPPSVNKRLWELAVNKYGPQIVAEIESLIDEFLRLAMPAGLARGWNIAARLAAIDDSYDPAYEGIPSVGSDDPRQNCAEREGDPQLDIPTKEALKRSIRQLVKRPTKTKEPTPLPQRKPKPVAEPEDEPVAKTPDEEIAEKLEAPDDLARDEPQPAEMTKQGGEGETPEQADEPEEAEGEGAGKGKDEAEEEAEEDETSPQEMEGEGEGEGDDQEATGEGGSNPSDELGDEEGEGEEDKEAQSAPAHGAGRGQAPPPDPLLRTLSALAREAIKEVADEVEDRHEAIKASEFTPSMGGARRGGLDSKYVDPARRLGHMFRDINQDLRAQTSRGHKRGRLDTRRLPVALASNSARIFKRRLPDLSTEAALAVHIMIDTSGSMYNAVDDTPQGTSRWWTEVTSGRMVSKVDVALPAGFALAKGVELAGHIAKVTTYSDGDVIQKNWLDEMYRIHMNAPGGGTDPSSALIKARPDFLYLARETDIHNHVLIIITDGDWNFDCKDVCTGMLTKLVKDGVHIIEIGIGVEPVPIHGAWKILTIPDVLSLSSAMADPLRKLAIEIAKQAKRRAA